MAHTTIGWTATPKRDKTGLILPNEWWSGYTHNPWRGCQKVSDECRNCYAETLATHYWPTQHLFGPVLPEGHPRFELSATRQLNSAQYWSQPLSWNKKAGELGYRLKVFCASMADIFEDVPRFEIQEARRWLWSMIEHTPNLNWLLLTKRPENIERMLPHHWLTSPNDYPQNIWLGTSIGIQNEETEKRYNDLMGNPFLARWIRFLSCEPLLGPIDFYSITYRVCPVLPDWIITGGESGPQHRPLNLDHVRAIRDFCQEMDILHFFKQVGGLHHDAGGRDLDGRTWDEMPTWLDEITPVEEREEVSVS